MNQIPNGADLLETLVKLYAAQEGISITYEVERPIHKEYHNDDIKTQN